MKVAVINCSPSVYNLAVDRIAALHRFFEDEVYAGVWQPIPVYDVDKVYFSVIFTWDVPAMIENIKLAQSWGKKIEIGGPAATFLPGLILEKTGIRPHVGLDDRFEHFPGEFKMTFTSRGCIHKCDFCGVKLVEPDPVEYSDYNLAPMIGDNNLIATSWEHQLQFVNNFVNFDREIDINSGFDVRFFEEKHLKLYSRLKLQTWRFAFDTMEVKTDVRRVARMMRKAGHDRHHVTFYALIGFPGTTPDECQDRLETIIDLGMNPYAMRYHPINRTDWHYVAPGWTEDLLMRMSAYYQTPYLWQSDTFANFDPGKGGKEIPEEQLSFVPGK